MVKLRRAFYDAPDELRKDLGSGLSRLEEIVGPTISRRQAADILGVSHTALDRWVNKGEIASLPSSSGRSEIPVSHVVDLLGRVDDRREQHGSSWLASLIHDQQREADRLTGTTDLLPRRSLRKPFHGHRRAELRSLAVHRLLAARLDKVTVAEADRRLRQWTESGAIHPHWASQWQRVLALPREKIAKTISSDSEAARELRQSSPFVGLLTEQERKRLHERLRDLVS